jgi:hypothetical protein
MIKLKLSWEPNAPEWTWERKEFSSLEELRKWWWENGYLFCVMEARRGERLVSFSDLLMCE